MLWALFIVLRIAEVITWSWWLVIFWPVVVTAMAVGIYICVASIVMAFTWAIDEVDRNLAISKKYQRQQFA